MNKPRRCLELCPELTLCAASHLSGVCLCWNQCAASVRFCSVFSRSAGYGLLFVYEGQQEESYVMWAPVACVRGHRRPVAALHQTLAKLEVDPPLQLHCKRTPRYSPAVKKSHLLQTEPYDYFLLCSSNKPTRLQSGRSGPSHHREAVGRLAFWVLLLLFLSTCSPLQT